MLDPHRRVLFLDTNSMGGREDRKEGSPSNAAEAGILMQVVASMCAASVSQSDICLVSPYRAQVNSSGCSHLTQILFSRNLSPCSRRKPMQRQMVSKAD